MECSTEWILGFNLFVLKPQFPDNWSEFSVENIERQGKHINIYVSRVEKGCEIRINSDVYYAQDGENVKIIVG